MQIETLPADQQELARKEWEKVLRPFKRREPRKGRGGVDGCTPRYDIICGGGKEYP